MKSAVAALIAMLLVSACSESAGPPVVISELRIFAPLPGSASGVAYLTVANDSEAAISIIDVRSPQFGQIEMHETVIDQNGVSSMNRLQSVEIAAGDSARFTEGGKHLMLMSAQPDTRAGTPVTLEIELSDGLLIVSATLQNRLPAE